MSDTIPQDTPQKQCSKCKALLPATTQFFTRDKTKPSGLYSSCKVCCAAYKNSPEVKERIHKQRQERWQTIKNDPEKLEHKRKAARDSANRPEIRKRKLEYMYNYSRRPEVHQRILAYHKEYDSKPENKARAQAYMRIYQCMPGSRKRQKTYREQHYEDIIKIQITRRRARKKGVFGTHSPQQIKELLHRQKRRCYYCKASFKKKNGKHIYHIEHTFPLSRVSGTDIPANDISYLVLACPTCNIKKKDKFPWEWPEGGRLL